MRRRRALQIALAVLVLAGLGSALGFGPAVRARAAAQAERRGATLDIGVVRPGWGRVWLRDVTVKVPDVPSVDVHFESLEVRMSARLAPTAVRAHGGSVNLRGAPEEVARQIREWRSKQGGGSGGRGASVMLEGVGLTWSQLGPGDGESIVAWGLRYEREADVEEVSIDLARGSWRGLAVEAAKASVRVGRQAGRRQLERLAAESVAVTVDLDSDEIRRVVRDSAEAPPAVVPGAKRPGPESGSGARGGTEPAVAQKVDGKPAPESGWSPARFMDAGRGPRVRRGLARVAAAFADVLPPEGELDFSGLRLRLVRDGDALNVGPARLHVVRAEGGVSVGLMPAPDAEHALRLSLELPDGPREVKASIAGGPVSLAALGVQEGDFGLREVTKATLEAKGNAVLSANGSELGWVGSGRLEGLAVEKKWLAAGRVRGLSLGLSGKGRLALDGTRLHIDESELSIGKIRGELKGELTQGEGFQTLWLEGGIPLASCQAMLDSTPDGLAPLLSGMRASGTFALSGKLELDTRAVDKMVTRWTAANECRITDVPVSVSPRKFASSWVREVLDADGRPNTVHTGPGTLTWVPRTSISRHMETAVLICEDAGFFRHRGFDEEAIRNSIRENVRAKRFVRGASTVSMQLAKNLYLPREKTVSRKLQEAVLTQLLEQELSKDQVLELYLNVIEFGPGIYGIGPAAAYYFNTTADQLSLGQALYLASILPNPKRQYFGADGAVTPGWSAYLRKLMRIASKIRRINDQELEEALSEQVTFKVPYSPRVLPEGDEPTVEGGDPSAQPETEPLPTY